MLISRTNIKKYYCVLSRHGESIWNKGNKFTGWTDIPLSSNGILDSFHFSQYLTKRNIKPSSIFSSNLTRCLNTAKVIRSNLVNDKIDIYTSWRLNERFYGNLEGICRDKAKKEFGCDIIKHVRCDFESYPPSDGIIKQLNENKFKADCKESKQHFENHRFGESGQDILNRLLPYWYSHIVPEMINNNIPLIVTHKHTIRVLLKHLKNMNKKDFKEMDIKNSNPLLVTLNENFMLEEMEFLN